jgi:translation initiation factor 1
MSDKIVYSTESGDQRKKQKAASRQAPGNKRDGIVRVRRESKGRGGKTITAIYGLPMSPGEISDLAATLKQKCGTGGTVKDGVIIIQGDKVEVIMHMLQNEGFAPRRSGGS